MAFSKSKEVNVSKYSVAESDLSVEGFSEPAFSLLNADSNVLKAVTPNLSSFSHIRGANIRIEQDSNPIANANATFDLHALDGYARISIDRAQIPLFSPHSFDKDVISNLSSSFFDAVNQELQSCAYGHHLVQFSFHAALESGSPEEHTRGFVRAIPEDSDKGIGNSVTYYFGKNDERLHSSVTLDMSSEHDNWVFARVAMAFDATKISLRDLKDLVVDHSNTLLNLIGLEAEW